MLYVHEFLVSSSGINYESNAGADPGNPRGTRGQAPLDPRFLGPKLSIFKHYLIFLLHFTQHMISNLEVFVLFWSYFHTL